MFLKIFSICVVVILIFSACNSYPKKEEFKLKAGHILFQDLDCGPLCDAIDAVTQGYKGADISHMGLVVEGKDSALFVLEAIGAGVVQTPLSEFLSRSADSSGNPKVFVARVKRAFKHLIPIVLEDKNKYLKLPYNSEYILNDSSYYCSQLIHTLFKNANKGKDFFKLYPMTFKEPETQEYFQAWVEYYTKLNCEIPEGEPGLNPGGMSRSDKIEIIHMYGIPDGTKN